MERTDVMVHTLVRKEIGRGSQQVLERFVEGMGDEEPEELSLLEGIDNRFVIKRWRLEKLGDEVRREWFEAVEVLDGREEDEAEEMEEEEVEEVRSEGVRSSEESKYSTEVDYEELDRTDEEGEVEVEM